MKKLERLACLYLTFLNNPGGLRFSDIKEALPLAYEGDSESARRKFERDKDDLRSLGMELNAYADGQSLPDGRTAQGHVYIPNDELKKLPEIRLADEEARTLAAALFDAIEIHRGRDDELANRLASAAAKLLYKNPAVVLDREMSAGVAHKPAGSPEETEKLGRVHEALMNRRVMKITYPERTGEAGERSVEGRGLVAHRGRWCLVAHCRRVGDIRKFYLDRIREISITDEKHQPDPHFNIKDYSLHPLALRMHDPLRVRLTVLEDQEEQLRDFFTGLPEFLEKDVEWNGQEVSFPTTNKPALYSWMIRHPGAVVKIGPDEVHAGFVEHLARMKSLHA